MGSIIIFPCKPNTTGTLYANISAHNYIPAENSISVTNNPGIQLFVSSIHIGDHNSQIGSQKSLPAVAGETIDIVPTESNNGLTGATGVVGMVSTRSSYISSVSQQYTSFGAVPSLGTKAGTPKMTMTITSNTPDHQLIPLLFSTGPGNLNTSDIINVEVHAPSLQQTVLNYTTSINNDLIIDPNDYVYLTFNMINTGSGIANSLVGVLTSTSPYIQSIISGTQSLSNIIPYSTGSNASPYVFRVVNNYAQQSIALTLTVTSAYNQQWVFPITLDLPPVITGLDFTSTNTSISPFWAANLTVKGYNLYRSFLVSGPFDKINNQIITGYAGYTDADLPEGSIYYYMVRSVSNSGIESANSTVKKAWTSLAYHPNWPQTCNTYGELRSENSANTADIDGDLKKEIFIGISDLSRTMGTLYGFKENGDEIYYNIGDDPTKINGFYHYSGVGPHCVPALGDVNNNGVMEVLSTTGQTTIPGSNWVFAHSVLDNNNDFKPDLLWQPAIQGPDALGPVLADIDGNGTKEILVKSIWNAPFYVFNSDGTNHTGFPVAPAVSRGGFGMPVACSFLNTSSKQVIFPAQEGIFVYNNNGTPWLSQNPDGMFYNHTGDNMACAPVMADISNTGNSYQMVCVSARGDMGRVFILNFTGDTITGWGYDDHVIPLNDNGSDGWMPSPAVGDIDNDGRLEVCIADAGYIYCWKYDGTVKTGFPLAVPNLRCALESPLIADIDGDGVLDLVVSSNSVDGNIYAFHTDGSPVVGWPLRIKAFATPVIDDIDNDGMNEIIASEGNTVYVWDTKGLANRVPWGKYRKDSFNSGVYPIGSKKIGETDIADDLSQTDNLQLAVYPNPAKACLNFSYSLPVNITSVKIRIVDMYGKTIDSFTVNEKQGIYKLHTEKYAPGMYMYKVIGYENLNSKFVVTK